MHYRTFIICRIRENTSLRRNFFTDRLGLCGTDFFLDLGRFYFVCYFTVVGTVLFDASCTDWRLLDKLTHFFSDIFVSGFHHCMALGLTTYVDTSVETTESVVTIHIMLTW